MSNMLRPPSLGPIVGHTTDASVRVWIRAADAGEHRSIGVAGLCQGKRVRPSSVTYFRLRREYDRTGVSDFNNLKPDTEYAIRTGSLALDSTDSMVELEFDEIKKRLPKAGVWADDLEQLPAEQCEARVRTFPKQDAGGDLAFIFGSCRYPGLLWGKKRADLIFKAIYERFHNGQDAVPPRLMIMAGDQIYADMLNRHIPFGLADTEKEFRERYLTAFGAPNTRRLLRTIPQYMILDDHEIEDNWVQGRVKDSDKRTLFNLAISAYRSYQWSHCPRNHGQKLFYQFECAGYPFFVLDGRTQRMREDKDEVLEDNHLLGIPAQPHHGKQYKGQIDIVCEWLKKQQDKIGDLPKFIVSASVFVPNDVARKDRSAKQWKSDSWPAFPETRRQLLRTITDHGVQNVVFLSGDIHCSNVAEISFFKENTKTDLKAWSITSSAFYWPFPFADGDPLNYIHDSQTEKDPFDIGNGHVMHYKAWDFQQEDNFTQVTIEQGKKISVRTFDKRGRQLDQSELALAGGD